MPKFVFQLDRDDTHHSHHAYVIEIVDEDEDSALETAFDRLSESPEEYEVKTETWGDHLGAYIVTDVSEEEE